MMKIRNRLLATMLLAALFMLLTGTALADSYRFGVVDGGRTVNLREYASSSSDLIGVYEEGTWMRITGESGGYYKVKGPDGKTGYMGKEYIYISAGAKGIIGIVDHAGYLNLRKTPSLSGRVLAQYDDGTPCILLSESDGWYHVSVDGKIGYFDAKYIETKYMTYSPDVATIVTASGGSLRMRKGPGSDYSTVKTFDSGDYVMILQKGDGWWKVSADGYVGFMDSDCLEDGIIRRSTASSGSGSSSGSSSGSTSSGSADGVLRPGATGSEVRTLQSRLKELGYYALSVDGTYGSGTRSAVAAFQARNNLDVDGIAGSKTLTKLYSSSAVPAYSSSGGSSSSGSSSGTTTLRPGATGADVRKLQSRLKELGYLKSSADGVYGSQTRAAVEAFQKRNNLTVDGIAGKNTLTRLYSSSAVSAGSSSSSSGSSSGSSSSGSYATVNNPGRNQKLYLRQTASKDSKSLGKYSNGTKVTVLVQGTEWCKVKVDGKTGYMMTEYLKLVNLPDTPTMEVDHPSRSYVNLRNAPSQESGSVLERVKHGREVTVLVPGDTWTKVRYNGTTGYMMTRFLDD